VGDEDCVVWISDYDANRGDYPPMISSRHILRVLTLSALVPFPFAFASATAGAPALSATYTGETLHVADGGVDRGTNCGADV
jgi:hypothetical protein